MNEILEKKWLVACSLSILVILLVCLPFLILCLFVHPSFIDDYTFLIKTNELGTIRSFLYWYNNWTGRYSLCFLMSINPVLIKSLLLYRLVIFCMIFLIPLLAFFLFRTLFRGFKHGFYLGFTALFSFFFFFQLPSINEGLYWMTGAFAYLLPTLCLLLILILFFKLCTTDKKKVLHCFLASLLSLVLIGTNEISMLTFDTFLFIIIGYRLLTKRKTTRTLYVVFIVSIIASVVVVLAPGNAVRGELFPLANDFGQTIKMTVVGLLFYIAEWSMIASLMAIIAFFIIEKQDISFNSQLFSIPIKVSLGIFISVLIVGFIVPAWSTGQMPNPRAINVLFAVFLLGFFYHVIFIYHIIKTYQLAAKISYLTVLCVLLSVFLLTFYPGKRIDNNIKTAYIDLFSGKAKDFDEDLITLYKSGNFSGFPKERIPASIGWDITKETYEHGYPKAYFKTHQR